MAEQSRQFGFLRFSTLEEAEEFMDRNYPVIYLYGDGNKSSNGDASKVRIAFGRERKEQSRNDDGDWACPVVCLALGPRRLGPETDSCTVPYQQLLDPK